MKNILVAIDFLNLTNKLLETAAFFAEKFDAKVWLVHVAAPPPDFVGYEVGPQYIRDSRAGELRQEHRDLQALAKGLEEKGLKAEALLVQGETASSLVEEAGDVKADLLILGSTNHGKIFESLFGSVWEEVVKKSKTPVLILPA